MQGVLCASPTCPAGESAMTPPSPPMRFWK